MLKVQAVQEPATWSAEQGEREREREKERERERERETSFCNHLEANISPAICLLEFLRAY